MISITQNINKMIKSKRMTYFAILTGTSMLGIYYLLPYQTQVILSNFIRNPFILTILLITILCIGYFNFVSGVILLLLLVNVLLPLSKNTNNINNKNTLDTLHPLVLEGFDNKSIHLNDEDALNSNNKSIQNLFKPGYFRQKLEEARKDNKNLFEKEMAKNKSIEYFEKRKHKKNKQHKRENFNNTNGSSNSSNNNRVIEQRKFNPANEEDTNLLLTMETFDDIRDRIKYTYESKPYLKKYIKEKLTEVVELLDLVPED